MDPIAVATVANSATAYGQRRSPPGGALRQCDREARRFDFVRLLGDVNPERFQNPQAIDIRPFIDMPFVTRPWRCKQPVRAREVTPWLA